MREILDHIDPIFIDYLEEDGYFDNPFNYVNRAVMGATEEQLDELNEGVTYMLGASVHDVLDYMKSHPKVYVGGSRAEPTDTEWWTLTVIAGILVLALVYLVYTDDKKPQKAVSDQEAFEQAANEIIAPICKKNKAIMITELEKDRIHRIQQTESESESEHDAQRERM